MKKPFKIICLSLIIALFGSVLMSCDTMGGGKEQEKDYPVKLETEYSGKEVDLATKEVRNYIRYKDNETRLADLLYRQLSAKESDRVYGDKQNISFSWQDTGENETFTLHFASDKDFKNELFTYETTNNTVDDFGVFVPGETYYYKVVGSKSGESKVDNFKTKDLPVRYISSGAVLNVRDIGGWETADGKTVKYGMLYRGGALDGSEHPQGAQYILERGSSRLDDKALKVFNDYLGMKGEIDLRGVKEDQHETPTFGGGKNNMCQVADVAISQVWSNPNNSTLKQAVKTYFEFLANKDNYPVYFHCNGGADRTGALAFLINGLLGVDYSDLAIDYELTTYSFAAGGIRNRCALKYNETDGAYFDKTDDSWLACENCKDILLSIYRTDNLQNAIESYLLDCGVTKSQISSIKTIMTEEK